MNNPAESNPVLVDVYRKDIIESRHCGSVIVVNNKGETVFSLGDVERSIYPRSSIKFFQAIPLVESGAVDQFGLSGAELALSCASHIAEPRHTESVKSWLARMQLTVADLENGRALYLDVRHTARRLAFAHPRLHQGDGLLLTRGHHPEFAHQCARRRARYLTPGGDICLLSDIRPDQSAAAVSLTEGRFPFGMFSRPDVAFDGERIVFGYASAEAKDLDEPLCESEGGTTSIGNGTYFQVWEVTPDGSAPPRQITRGTTRRSESTDPIYLPGGRIAFMSPQAVSWEASTSCHATQSNHSTVMNSAAS